MLIGSVDPAGLGIDAGALGRGRPGAVSVTFDPRD
jgi:hypothetical protein